MRWHSYTLLVGLLLMSITAAAQSVRKSMARLPDTGQNERTTALPGEDASITIDPPYLLRDGDVVIDTVTSLMWESVDGGEMTWDDAIVYCDTLRKGGFMDWRMPTSHELFSINDLGRRNPALPIVFERTGAEYWWSVDRLVQDPTRVWCTNAGGGIGPHPITETISAGGTKRFHVRAVRDRLIPTDVASHYVDRSNGTVDDSLTGRRWQQYCLEGVYTWEEALLAADTLVLDGASDWRLPNIRELQSINAESRRGPSVELLYFPCVTADVPLWSSTSQAGAATTHAWTLLTDVGIVTYAPKSERRGVLCVRGGSVVTSVADEMISRGELVGPIPSSGLLRFHSSVRHADVIDLTGAHVLHSVNGIADLSSLAPGVYLALMMLDDDSRHSAFVVRLP